MDTAAMRVLILYETRRGHALEAARAIRDELRTRGQMATVAPTREALAGIAALPPLGGWVDPVLVAPDGAGTGA